MKIEQIQRALQNVALDGWLFFDHHRRDPIAYRLLELPPEILASRRWYYYVPAQGSPRKLVHRIESGSLDTLPGEKHVYSSWLEQQARLTEILAGSHNVAMQYSRNCAIPYISLVDAGTVELVRANGIEIFSSADLVQQFESTWSEEQLNSHLKAAKLVDTVVQEAFQLVGHRTRSGEPLSEYEVQQFIRERFQASGLYTDHGPIVAVNQNASDPHYEPTRNRSSPVKANDLVLIDLWAKLPVPAAVYYDITWTAFCGDSVPDRHLNVFSVVKTARVAASEFAKTMAGRRESFAGFEVDDAARTHIQGEGFGEYFFHRTGHNIGTEVHGTGANMDNLESHDERQVIPRTCFSVEPGIYLPEFGIRSEVNVYVGDGFAMVTGNQQDILMQI